MGDMGDFWRDVGPEFKARSQEKRANNRAWSASFLTEQGIPYRTNNGGEHLMIDVAGRRVDFWPGTGKWNVAPKDGQGAVKSRGVRALVKWIQSAEAKASEKARPA